MTTCRKALRSMFFGLFLMLATSSPATAAEFDKFGIESVEAELSSVEAGAHPDFSTKLVVKTDPASPAENGDRAPYAALKDVVVELPPGLVGNLNSVNECTTAQFVTAKSGGAGCPFSSQVGVSEARIRGGSPGIFAKSPIYRLETAGENQVARLGFLILTVPIFINVQLRSNSDYGVRAEVSNLSALSPLVSQRTTLWGVPADPSHDTLRFTAQEALEFKQESPPRSAGHAPEPFLTNPTSCTGPLRVRFLADSYQEPGRFDEATAPLGEITNCEEVEFDPSFSLTATTTEAAAPSGAEATLTIPQNEGFDERATSHLRNAVVRLPEGMSINPGAADGLAACTEAEVGYQVTPVPSANCPLASKIASAVIDSPSLTAPIHGGVYQRPSAPGHLFRAWLVADELGVHVKIPGEFQLDPLTGQVTSLFLDTPQVPVRELRLRFKDGPRGVLTTPRRCGTYEARYALTPWSGSGDVGGAVPMTFDQNCTPPDFSPGFRAGAVEPLGGAFSRFVTELSQDSGESNLSKLQVTMPPGLLAKLKGVAVCSEADAGTGACPDASRVGSTIVATGLGTNPLWIPQPGKSPTAVYLAGPYKGAPYSLVVKTPAEAGPFDLGDVVVRVALQVDPVTTQVSAISDPLPQVVEGIPVFYRHVRIDLDRPNFAINPTRCVPMQVAATADSVVGNHASLAARFQVDRCARLAFKPHLTLSLKGGMKRSQNPALSAVLRMRKGANIASARVTLPPGLQIDNAHINNPCTRVQFDAKACPRKSILGRARASSPLLDQPLKGPVYFRSNGGERELPDLVADLHGPIHVILVGFIDSKHRRLRTTFASVPDAPVSRFQINLFGDKRGLLENNRNLCRSSARALEQFTGQNGKATAVKAEMKLPCKGKPAR
jgi:hypothetical protein